MGKFIDLKGKKFGKLLVIKKTTKTNYGKWKWLCECECGNLHEVCGRELIKKYGTKSCGKCKKDYTKSKSFKHGMSKTRVYACYKLMKNRCYNKNNKRYYIYGGRDIHVCCEWLGENGSKNFINWALKNGYEDNLTLDRIDNNKGYSPENCRWATRKEQSNNLRNNRKFIIENKEYTISEISDKYNIPYKTLYSRIRNNWDIVKCINTPVKNLEKVR